MTIATSAPRPGTMDVDEFQAFLETRPKEERWHLIEGVAVMMNPPTLAHQRIGDNFQNLLNAAFLAKGLDLYAYQEISVRTPGVNNFQPRPDVAVFSGVAGYDYYTDRYQLVAEVLSPTNTKREIELKLRRYREAPECLYAVVINSRTVEIELYARDNDWQLQSLKGVDSWIELSKFGLRCCLGELYRGTPLDPSGK
jgi:Uma2 family endonuclease